MAEEQRKSSRPDWAQTQEGRGVAVEAIQPRELSLMESGGFEIKRLEDAWRLAEAVVKGGMAPSRMTAGSVVALWQAGAEMGITPMRSLAQLTHINGRIGMMVEQLGAEVRKKGAFAKGGRPKIRWELDGEAIKSPPKELEAKDWPDGLTAIAYAKPAIDPDEVLEREFSVLDARRARLWLKRGERGDSPWITYPARMLGRRALGFLLRDEFAEYLGAVAPLEELQDVAEEQPRDVTGTAEAPAAEEAAEETDDALFDAAVKRGEEIEDAQVVTGGSADAASPGADNTAEGVPAPGSPAAASGTPEPVPGEPFEEMTCVNCGARDEYLPEGPFRCTNSDPKNPHDVRVQKFPAPATKAAPKGPAVPPGPKPREAKRKTNINRKELVTMLACGDHPIPLEVVKEWTVEQLHAAHAWIQEEIVAMDAAEAGVEYMRRDLPRPSFVPEYGDPTERRRLNFPDPGTAPSEEPAEVPEEVQGALIHPFPDNPCMFAFEDGGACGLEAGHDGEHEPL